MSLSSWLRRALFSPAIRISKPGRVLRHAALRVESLEDRALLTAGALDPTFGTGGKVTSGTDYHGQAVVVQPDSKLVVAGWNGHVLRFNPNGTPDAGFGTGGVATVNLPGMGGCRALALQPDGKILVTGDAGTDGLAGDFAVARLNADGTPDAAFGSGGRAVVNVSASKNQNSEWVSGVVVQADGKIVLGGNAYFTTRDGSNTHFALVRFTAAGVLDTSFDGDGKVITDFNGPSGYDSLNALALQPDGKFVAVGTTNGFGNAMYDFAVARYTTDGSLDASFGTGGKVTTGFVPAPKKSKGSDDKAYAVAIQADGKIVVAGSTYLAGAAAGSDFALARYNPNGTLDATFDGDGKATVDFGSGNDGATSVAVQVLGGQTKIVVGGSTRHGAETDFALARLNATTGALDTSFGSGGKVTTDFGTASDYDYECVAGLAIQPDGKIVAVGDVWLGADAGFAILLARYDSE